MSVLSANISSTVFPLSLLFFVLFIPCCRGCDPGDRAALLEFSNAMESPVWLPVDASLTDCCSWVGVTCSGPRSTAPPHTRRVVGLKLNSRSLNAPLSGSLGSLDCLTSLNLSRNNLSGSIPDELFQPLLLEKIDLSSNSFSGPLSSVFGNLAGLAFLDVSNNNLSGSLPNIFDRLKRLKYFLANGNSLVGTLPPSLSSCVELRYLHLADNSMSGRIDVNFTAMPQLESLSLENNHFTGHFPRSISSCRNLKVLYLAGNKLHGRIARGFDFPPSLRFVLLGYNNFSDITRVLLSLQKCQNLTGLHLSGSFKKELMPQDEIIGFPNLKALSISSCELSGSFPMWLSKSDKLVMLSLARNFLSGQIPLFLTQLKNLNGSEKQNDYVISAFAEVGNPDLSFRMKPLLDLSSNLFSGNTWMQFSNLRQLVELNLSHNSFTGSIPDDFSDLESLQILDLSSNQINGTIPSILERLTSLSSFCVANNNLHGDVPTGSQFLTFPSSCFDGNPQLCYVGKHGCYPRPTFAAKPDEQHGKTYKVIDTGLPFVIGVLVGYITTFFACGMHFYWTRSKRPRPIICNRRH